mgnify:CR=1 FL=1
MRVIGKRKCDMKKENEVLKRRDFFGAIGKTAVVGALMESVLPFKLFSTVRTKATESSFKISPNPMAVKRSKKG